MTGNEENSFRLCYRFYAKWREGTIETDEQWNAFAADVGQLATDLSAVPCPLGERLFDAVLEAINDLYRNGMKPVEENYFGRNDLGH